MSELDISTGDDSTLYTPSTRRVRAAYVHGVGGSTWYEGKAEALRESFDRWLAEVKAQVIAEYQKQHWDEFNKSLALDPYRQGEEQ